MRFCKDCGSYMRGRAEGLWCPKCGKLVPRKKREELIEESEEKTAAIYVIGESSERYSEVTRQCPECGNSEALRWSAEVSGEHAGIRRERTIERFRCIKCGHAWSASS